MSPPYPRLFSSIRIGHLTLTNRLCHVATLGNFAEANLPSQRQADYYAARARGGVGLIVSEGITAHPKSVPTACVVAGFDPRCVDGLRRIADAVHRHGVPMLAQLWHVGRQQLWSPISAPWAPSAIPDPLSGTIPHAMSRAEIDEVVEGFAVTAVHARDAGFDGVELHGAHGYLLTQFLSPWSNRRRDEYGGALPNRLRLVERIIERIRSRCGRPFALGVKLNGHEFVDGGIDLAEAQRIAARLAATGAVDYLAVSQGNFSKSLDAHAPDMHFPRAPFRHLARGIKEAAGGLPVLAMARFVSPADAEAALEAGDADLVGMSRALVADPDLPRKAREGRTAEIRPCIMCNVCWGAIPQGKPMLCIYNPSVGQEATIDVDAPPPAALPKRVVVVGGGLAGLEASRVAALRGHRVILLEQSARLGGQANLAARLPGRAEFGDMTRYLLRRVERLPIDVRLRTRGTAERVLALAPDAVVVATGALPPERRLGGASRGVSTTWDVIAGRAPAGRRVVLLDRDGDHEGCGVAELLAARGARVWFVTPFDLVGPSMNYLSRIGAQRRLLSHGVTFLTGTTAIGYAGGTVTLLNLYARREARLRDVDAVVLAGPNRASAGLVEALAGNVPELHAIGDCYAPRKAAAAVHEGHRVGRLL